MNISADKMYEVGGTVLGYVGNVASWRRPTAEGYRLGASHVTLCISSAASTDEGVHEPAQSLTLVGREALLALRTAIDDALTIPATNLKDQS